MKKTLQPILLFLLLLAVSSNLLASSYSRTAGGSWDDWGWSADWIPPFSFPIGQAAALGLGGEAATTLKATLKASKEIFLAEKCIITLERGLKFIITKAEGYAGIGTKAGVLFMKELDALRASYKLLLRSSILKWLGAILVEGLDFVLGVSTPNFFQFLPDSARSGVDTFQLGWSRTAGPWLYYFTWWLLGTPGGDLSGIFDDITLFNEGTDSLNFDLEGNRTLNGLNVVGNSWTLFGGTLTLRTWVPNGYGMLLRYSGPQTLTLETPLDLPQGLAIGVPDQAGTVRLLGDVNLRGELRKTGYGTLLMEAPLRVYEGWGWVDNLLNYTNPWTGKRSPRMSLDEGTLGIAPASLVGNQLDFFVKDDSRLFALNGDINIPWDLFIDPDATLDIIDNPKDPTSHSITFSGDKYDRGTINQLSHGDLIFEGTDHFEGTINTYDGYGRIVLNGDTGANIEMKGGEIAGIGGTRGDLTARNGAIISPGYNGKFGTLSFGNVDLDKSIILNFTLGLFNRVGNSKNALIQVDGNLTLAGNLNISAGPGFEAGNSYMLFKYGGDLTYNGLDIRSVPEGYDASKFCVQTQMKGQVNLFVDDPDDPPPPDNPPPDNPPPDNPPPKGGIFSKFQFWDGGRTTADGTIVGGDGVWNNTDKTWSSIDGLSKKRWDGYRAVFGGDLGRVDVQDNVSFRKIDFLADGYTIYSSNNSKLLANDSATIKVDSTYQADISAEITGNGSITKKGLGILILSHDNSYTGGTVVEEGTLIVNTSHALSSGSVTLEGGLLGFGNTQTLEIGSYTQNQDVILALRVNSPMNYDQLVVNGIANLGGTLLIDGKPSNFGREMLLITSEGLNGRFDDIQFAQKSLKELSANYDDGKNVYVTPHFALTYPYAKSRNARALARHLDLFSNSGWNDEFFNTLADLTLEQVPVALETLVPRQVLALSSIALSVGRSQMHNIQSRPEDLNSGYASYGQLNANTSKQHGLSSAGALPQMNFLMNKAQELWSFYMHGDGSFGRQRQGNEYEVIGYDYGQGGTFAGADYHLNDKVYVGGAVSYTYTDASFHGNRGSLSTDSYFGHLYAAYAQPKGFNLISSLSFGDHEFDLRRRALTDTARSQPQGREVDFQSQVSYNILWKPNLAVSPYGGLSYSSFWIEGFQEYSSQASLKLSDDQTNSLRSSVGVKAQYEKPFRKGIRKASVEAHVAWEHEYCDAQSRSINAKWVGSRAPSFPVQGGRIDPDTLISGVNLRVLITHPLSVTAGYNLAANQDYVSHGFSVGVNVAF